MTCRGCLLPKKVSACSRCKGAFYCGKVCQRNHWPEHKLACPILAEDIDKMNILSKKLEGTPGKAGWPTPATDKMYIACSVDRNGVPQFCKVVEDSLYPEGTEKNELFQTHYVAFCGQMFVLLEVALANKIEVMDIARSIGMKVCEGVPTMYVRGTQVDFPLQGSNIVTLENRERPAQTTEQITEMLKKAGISK